jgi:hypothetical protein
MKRDYLAKTICIFFTTFASLLAINAPAQTPPALLWGKVSGPWASQFDGSFGAIAVNPSNPNIILIGSSVLGGPGILKSTNGGTTWTAKNTGINLLGIPAQNLPPITKIVFSPSNPSIVYFCAAVDNGLSPSGAGLIYKSVDGGESWLEINGQQNIFRIYQIQGAVYDMDVNPQNPNIVYAGVGGQGVMETTDGGIDWSTVYAASSTPGAADFFIVVRVLPTQPNTVFFSGFTYYTEDTIPVPIDFSTTGTQGLVPISLHKSTDGGSTWSTIPDPSTAMLITDLQFEKASGDLYESTIAYQTPLFFNVENSGIFKSLDSGQTWQPINQASFASLDQLPFVALLANPSSVNDGVFASGGLSTMLVGTTNAGANWMNLDPCLLNAYIGRAALSSNTLFILTSVGIYRADASSLFSTVSPAPTTTSISPVSLPTSSSPQLITIYGTNFKPAGDPNASMLIFHDPANNPYVRTPTNVTANSLQYYVNVQSATGTWSVIVTNGGSAASNPQTFTVYTPPANTGSLVVNLSPSGIGVQWQVNGTYHNSGDVVASLTPGQYTVSFKSVSGYTTPASFAVNIAANAQTTTNATYSAVAATTYTLTLNAASGQGSITPSPIGSGGGNTFTYNSGSLVQLTATATTGYHFTSWSGDASGTVNPTTITLNGNKNVTASFATGDPNLGTISVTIQPAAAVTAGAQWKFNSSGWTNSGASFTTPLLGANQNYLQFSAVSGWITPSQFYVTVGGGQTTNVTVTYQQDMTPGLLTVTLSPPDAVNAGAHWHVNGGTYGNGASVSLSPNTYTVSFDSVSGWTAPVSQSVTIQPSGTTVFSGIYTPPAGQPVIISVSPPIGPLAGGTLMTINGANFTAPATVLVGGKSAANIAVSSTTQITCLTPVGSAYGSTNVVVQFASGSATNSNGFAYGLARGNKLDVLSAIGGFCFGVAANGNYAYIGEGRNFLVLDISQSTPSKVGCVTLPGTIRGIALLPPSYHYAYVADGEGGLQVVDVSSPTTPKSAGFYYTTNQIWATAISIFGGRAYVADEIDGLQIFDLSNPTIPAMLSSTNVGGGEAIVVKGSVNGVFGYVSTGGSLCIVDVSNPLSPVLRGQTSIYGGSAESLALSGNYVYAAALNGNLEIIDVSNTNAPLDVGHAPGISYVSAVTSANGYIYAISQLQYDGFYIFSPSGSSLTLLGQKTGVTSTGYNLLVSGTKAYAAGGLAGLEIVDVSNPYGPSLTTTFTDSGLFTTPYYMAVSGNTLCSANGDFKVFDVTQPANINLVGQLSIGGSKMVAGNGKVYVVVNNVIDVVNIATPTSPQVLATIPSSTIIPSKLALVGTRLYAVGQNNSNQPRFVAIDVSNPSSPVVLGTKDFTDLSAGIATTLAINGTRAIVGSPNNYSLRVLDISNIGSPQQIGIVTNVPSTAIATSGDGDYLYVVSGSSPATLTVMSLANPSSLVILTNIVIDSASSTYHGLDARGSELFVSTFAGVYVFDISVPSMPTLSRSYASMSGVVYLCAPSDSANQSDIVYAAESNGGIVVLREQDIQAPEVYITDPIFGDTWTTTTSSTELGGGSDDNVGVSAITWSNNRGGSGQVSLPLDNWYVSSIALYPGTNLLTVTVYDAAGNSGSNTLAVIYQTTNQNQTITFPAIANHTFGDAAITLDAAASSGLPATFSVVSGPATLTSSNLLTLNGAGTVTVQASQPGNSSYNPAPSTNVSFTVALANQAITFDPIPTKSPTDAPFALTATTSSGLPIYFSVLSGPAGINSSNYVTLLGAGTVSILAWQPGNSNYNAAAAVQQSFTVSQIPQTIAFGALSQQRSVDAPFPIYASASSGLPVSFSVLSGPAQLSGNVLTLTGAGTVTVRASQAGNSVFAPAANVDQSLTVLPRSNTVGSPQYNVSGFNLTFYGIVGSNYVFQASSNLVNWTTLLNFNCTNSIMNFQDTSATGMARRFYQIKPQ